MTDAWDEMLHLLAWEHSVGRPHVPVKALTCIHFNNPDTFSVLPTLIYEGMVTLKMCPGHVSITRGGLAWHSVGAGALWTGGA